ncbi:hypothetical protein H2200_001690 [Cladophialophora chaetospira]|uniref:Uncharacterized protein n=1 Tax=Cladophialophora chaetospira TaxID=386627 RepID=A0AA38XLM4_9EURO|nr:hypothetical protein H2200_001690 [Cladophialophora chaetospira]
MAPAKPPSPAPSPPATLLISPPLKADDEPIIDPSLQRYIASLTDSHKNYNRFFSALLIPQSSQPKFFQDVKQFREQPPITYLLALGTSENYREVSRNFVASRFAHPWCRVQSDFGKGWHRASWVGGNAKADEKVRKEEERLHRLLVPIWIAMRRRMFPGDDVVKEWIEQDDEKTKEQAKLREEEENANQPKRESSHSSFVAQTAAMPTTIYPELGFATKDGPGRSAPTAPASAEPSDPGTAEAASKMFLGVAVTGFIMSDKRIRKYVQKKMKKK